MVRQEVTEKEKTCLLFHRNLLERTLGKTTLITPRAAQLVHDPVVLHQAPNLDSQAGSGRWVQEPSFQSTKAQGTLNHLQPPQLAAFMFSFYQENFECKGLIGQSKLSPQTVKLLSLVCRGSSFTLKPGLPLRSLSEVWAFLYQQHSTLELDDLGILRVFSQLFHLSSLGSSPLLDLPGKSENILEMHWDDCLRLPSAMAPCSSHISLCSWTHSSHPFC